MAETELKFQLAQTYYKQENAQAKVGYAANLKLVALWKQATCGSYEQASPEPPGFFDVVGNDRRTAWKALGSLSKLDAETQFCEELSRQIPVFETWLNDRLREKAEREERERQERLRQEQERLEKERQERERVERERQERARLERERQVRVQQQEEERLRLEQERIANQQRSKEIQLPSTNGSTPVADTTSSSGIVSVPQETSKPKSVGRNIIDPVEFQNGLRGKPEHELQVGRGEIVTVRVPKTAGKNIRIVWQFSTAANDIGFGLDFECAINGAGGNPIVDAILPIMRVTAQSQVIEGSHEAHCEGSWLLKFDNSYSYLRSKTVFYRILFQAL